jgi:hypothetical protein
MRQIVSRVSVVRLGVVVSLLMASSVADAQQLIDRVVARVAGNAITLSDVRAATGLGVAPADPASALLAVIDRQLLMAEVQRFPPPEPPAAAIDEETAALKMRAGAGLTALMQATGIDDARIRETARETLRIRAYLDQRFGTDVQVSDDEIDRYYRTHQEEFVRDGMLMPFAEAEPLARQRAAAERRQATINQWVSELRARADVTRSPALP